ncbi:MAG: ATP-binding protein [Acidobacteriota bacterium]
MTTRLDAHPLDASSPDPSAGPAQTVRRMTLRSIPLRWRFAVGGFLVGVVETTIGYLVGVRAMLGTHDVTWLVGGLVELSFGVFGYLLGRVVEARRRERRDAATIEAQLRELAAARARLAQAEKLASLGQLAGAILHEVRNPLAILRSMTQNLRESLAEAEDGGRPPTDDETSPDAICAQLVEEVDRLSHVTASLAAFSSAPRLERRPIALADLLERVRLLGAEMLRERGVRLEIETGPPAASLTVDADLVVQALLGLLDNAAVAMREASSTLDSTRGPGVVRLRARSPEDAADDAVILEVEDAGPGIDASVRDTLFEPFITTRADGHGLGLAVARQIARAHGGDLDLVDRPPPGATFRLRLPASLGDPS